MTLLGNENLIQQLKHAAAQGKLAHAYLICGPAGFGKKTLAQQLCQIILCPSGGCGNCRVCQKVSQKIHPDITYIEGEGKSGQIKVSAIREVRQNAYVLPNEADKKIYIIDGAEQMNTDAQNALLKVLEEPPASVVFLLLCARPERMLPTVLSRTVRLTLSPPERQSALVQLMKQTGQQREVCESAFDIADGNMGQALDLLQKNNIDEIVAMCEQFCMAVAQKNWYSLGAQVHAINADSMTFSFFASMVTLYLRALLRSRQCGDKPPAFSKSILQNQALFTTIKTGGLVRIISFLQQAKEQRAQFISPLLIETQLVCVCKEELV